MNNDIISTVDFYNEICQKWTFRGFVFHLERLFQLTEADPVAQLLSVLVNAPVFRLRVLLSKRHGFLNA